MSATTLRTPPPPAAVAWEYLTVQFGHGHQNLARPTSINGEPVRDWERGPLLGACLTDLGAQGWEVCGVGGFHGSVVILKRPVA